MSSSLNYFPAYDRGNMTQLTENMTVEGKVDWKGRPARKDKHGGQFGAMFIHVLFGCDSLATLGLAANLVTYFNGTMHYDISTASTTVTNLFGTSFLLSVAIAILADSFLGRYKSALLSALVELLGVGLLGLQAHTHNLKPPDCNMLDPTSKCERVGGGNLALLNIGLYLMAIGMAGVRAGLPPHGADQFDENDPKEAPQMSSFFNFLLLSTCVGGALSLVFVVWIQTRVGWDWGFAVSGMALLLGILSFVAGIPRFRIHVIGGTNPIVEITRVYVAAIRNRNLQLPESPEELHEIKQGKDSAIEVELLPHRDTFRFLDKAAVQERSEGDVESSTVEHQSPWALCTVTQVEKAKVIFGMLPIFGSTIIMSTCLAQLNTFSNLQGTTMDTRVTDRIKIPPASLSIIPTAFLIVIVPIYDRIVVPLVRRFTGRPTGITHLQRIGVGLLLSCISMATAGFVELKRKRVAESRGMLDAFPILQPLPISIFWLSFQYFIYGIADMFTYVGLLEFFYSEAPTTLKSTATSFIWCSFSFGFFLSSLLVDLVNLATRRGTESGGWLAGNNLNRNHLNYFYWSLSLLSFVNFLSYLFWAGRYKYRTKESVVSEEKAEGLN